MVVQLSSSRPGRPRNEAREQAILDAAIEVVSEVGYDRTSMDAVAARARASKATIYRRWPGKAQLVAEALRRGIDHDPAVVLPDSGSLRDDLVALVRLIRVSLGGPVGDLMFGLALAARSDPELGRVLHDQCFDTKHRIAFTIYDRARARGEAVAATDPALLDEVAPAVALLHMLSGRELDDAFVDHVVDEILLPLFTPPSPQEPPT